MTEWVITSNLNRFDVIGAFNKFDKINREQRINVELDDIVFIYISEPVSAIKYKCLVTKVDLPNPTVDNSEFIVDGIAREDVEKYMELQLLERLDNPALAYERLKENGLNSVQGPSKVTSQLSKYIHKVTLKFDSGLLIGQEISHDTLIKTFQCGNMGGMRPSNKTNTLVILTYPGKGPYNDRWKNGVLYYTGEGLLGDQEIKNNNEKLYYSNDNGIGVHLFEVPESNVYVYKGRVKLKENPYQDEQPDQSGAMRKVWIFPVVAAEIIDKEAETLIAENDENILSAKIKTFQLWIKDNKVREVELEQKRQKFVNDYTFKAIIDMKKEEYVVGLGRHDSFCYRIETELKDLGDIHGATSLKFGMYYGKSGEDLEAKYRIVKSKFGDNPDEALEKIKEQIVGLILAGKNKDYVSIKKSILAPVFRGKILATFYPESYLCIFSKEHLEYFLNKLNIPFSDDEDQLDKQLKLLSWKEKNIAINSWPPHTFERFLYTSYGNPSEIGKIAKEEQEERDKNYPTDYAIKIGVTIDQWKELIQNQEVFLGKDIEFLKRIYLSENHAATCYELGLQDGVSPSTYIKPVVALGRRISKQLSLNPIIRSDGSEAWWCIPFWGSYRDDNHFEWKLRPALAKALASVYPELELIKADEDEDDNLVEDLKNVAVNKLESGYDYKGKPKKKKAPVYSKGRKTYHRDRQTALNALAHAKYECEIDLKHPTFKRKKSPDVNYTEPHHLVPMAYSDQFEISLDVEENIVSLCSNCHNQLHYGMGSEDLLKRLFDERNGDLKKAGINISFETLMSMY